MDHSPSSFDADSLRQELMSSVPMRRIKALHALEQQCDVPGASAEQGAAHRFVARGIPFYAVQDASYLAWVDKAVSLWQRVQDAAGFPAAAAALGRPAVAARHA